jgi:hypothetical protein
LQEIADVEEEVHSIEVDLSILVPIPVDTLQNDSGKGVREVFALEGKVLEDDAK